MVAAAAATFMPIAEQSCRGSWGQAGGQVPGLQTAGGWSINGLIPCPPDRLVYQAGQQTHQMAAYTFVGGSARGLEPHTHGQRGG